MAIIDFEQPEGVIASLGGQTAINLAQPLMDRGVKIIGTDCAAIERAENRDSFEKILLSLNIPQPAGAAVTDIEAGIAAAERIGYPVLVRPSFVLGGRAMEIVADEDMLRHYLKTAVEMISLPIPALRLALRSISSSPLWILMAIRLPWKPQALLSKCRQVRLH